MKKNPICKIIVFALACAYGRAGNDSIGTEERMDAAIVYQRARRVVPIG